MKKILLVDDDREIRKGLRWVLERQGYEIQEAGDGKQALRIMAANAVDLMITDIMMPEKNGLEVIMELRQARPEVKIIAMSGGGFLGAGLCLCAALDFGASHALAKPFAMEEMVAAVESALEQG